MTTQQTPSVHHPVGTVSGSLKIVVNVGVGISISTELDQYDATFLIEIELLFHFCLLRIKA